MEQYQIVFSDIDGTLVDSNHNVSEKTRRAVQWLDGKGIPFVLVSSRPPQGILPLWRSLNITAPLACFGGGMILDADGKVLAGTELPREAACAVDNTIQVRWPGVCRTLYAGSDWLTETPDDPWVLQEQTITHLTPRLGAVHTVPPEAVMYKLMCMGVPMDIAAMQEELPGRFPMLSFQRSKPNYMEIVAAGVRKSAALHFLCEWLAIPPECTLAIGDNYNDLDMLEAAGMSVAMGNSPEDIRRMAGYVTLDNDHEGVRLALEHFYGSGNETRL